MKPLCAIALAAWLWAPPAWAEAPCRLALALGLDVSGSVDSQEYDLQVRGLVAALRRPDVARALLAQPETPVSLLVYEWSGPDYQRLLAPWQPIANKAALDSFATQLAAARRQDVPPSTALGRAVDVGLAHLAQKPACWQQTLDISGDGKNNTGPRPAEAKARALKAGVTVNALVIGADAPAHGDTRFVEISELSAYFRANVIAGANAFVEAALGFEDYEEAMARKLIRELAPANLSKAPEPIAPITEKLVKTVSRYSGSDLSSSAPPVSKRW